MTEATSSQWCNLMYFIVHAFCMQILLILRDSQTMIHTFMSIKGKQGTKSIEASYVPADVS